MLFPEFIIRDYQELIDLLAEYEKEGKNLAKKGMKKHKLSDIAITMKPNKIIAKMKIDGEQLEFRIDNSGLPANRYKATIRTEYRTYNYYTTAQDKSLDFETCKQNLFDLIQKSTYNKISPEHICFSLESATSKQTYI